MSEDPGGGVLKPPVRNLPKKRKFDPSELEDDNCSPVTDKGESSLRTCVEFLEQWTINHRSQLYTYTCNGIKLPVHF